MHNILFKITGREQTRGYCNVQNKKQWKPTGNQTQKGLEVKTLLTYGYVSEE